MAHRLTLWETEQLTLWNMKQICWRSRSYFPHINWVTSDFNLNLYLFLLWPAASPPFPHFQHPFTLSSFPLFCRLFFYHFIPIPKQPVARKHMGSIQLKLTSTTPIIQQVSTCSSWTGRDMITRPLHSSIHPSILPCFSPSLHSSILSLWLNLSIYYLWLRCFTPSFLLLSPSSSFCIFRFSLRPSTCLSDQNINLKKTMSPKKDFYHFHVIIMTLSSGSVDVCWCLHMLCNSKTADWLSWKPGDDRPWAGDHCWSTIQRMRWLKIEMLNER